MKAPTLDRIVHQREDGRWCKACPMCGKEQDYLRRNYAVLSLALGKLCKACSNKRTENCHRGFSGPVRLSWVNKCKVGAETRGLDWELSVEDIVRLYEAQDGVCALSGLPISWAASGQRHAASIDRIDSKKGYTLDNVQLVHKDINMMKQSFTQERFVALCNAVADKV